MADSPGMARTVTIPGVELVTAGTHAASTGITPVTPGHLADMVAANRDPGVDAAFVKIGHDDPRFKADLFDGEPAYGWVSNLRVEDRPELGQDGAPTGRQVATLIGDLHDVPAGLAAIMPKAFRRRSVEIGWGYKTAAGHKYSAALTGLALLGVTPPAVKGLADVVAMYSAVPTTTGVTMDGVSSLSVDPDLPPAIAHRLAGARADVGALAAFAGVDPAPITAWLAAAEAGVRARWAPSGNDGVHAPHPPGGPLVDEARIRQLLNLQATDDIEAAVARLVAPPGTPANAPAPGAPAPPAGLAAPVPPASSPAAPVTPAAPVAGTPPAATPTAPGIPPAPPAAGTPAPAPGTAVPAPVATTPPATPAASAPPVGLPAGVALPPGMSLISDAVLNELRAGTQAGIAAAQELATMGRERELVTAMRAGKIAPAELEVWRNNWTANPDGTRSLLAAMAPRFPTTEIGTGLPLPPAIDEAQWDQFEHELFGLPLPAPPAPPAPAGGVPTAPGRV